MKERHFGDRLPQPWQPLGVGNLPFPRTWDEAHGREMFHALANGDFTEEQVLEVWNDPTAGTRGIALGVLGRVRGDDKKVLAILRGALNRATEVGDQQTQVTCVDALARRFGRQMLPEFRAMWESKVHREVRTRILDVFSDFGVADYQDQALKLYKRGLAKGQEWSGGIHMGSLFRYLFSCASQGVGSGLEVKVLIRKNLSNLRGGTEHLYEMSLPGISDDSVPLTDIPDPTFRSDPSEAHEADGGSA